jgi:DNA repair protein RadC
MNKTEIKKHLANILQLNKKEKNKLDKLEFSSLDKQKIKTKLDLNTKKSSILDSFYILHQKLEMLLAKENQKAINNKEDAIKVIEPYMSQLQTEQLLAIYVNNRREIIDAEILTKGSTLQTVLDTGPIFKGALENNAQGILIAHNHPGGSAEFSEEDILETKSIQKTGTYLNIHLIDHLIYAPGDGYASYWDLDIHKEQ